MPKDGEEPRYRVYRGGRRADGKDPLAERLRGVTAPREGSPPPGQAGPRVRPGSPIVLPQPGGAPPPRRRRGAPGAPTPAPKRRRRRPPIGRIVAIGVPVLLLLLALWIGYGYLRFRDAISAANGRL